MLSDLERSGFSRLLFLGLITEAQRDAALADPGHCALDFAGPVRQLVWMVEQRIVYHGTLLAFAHRAAEQAGDAIWEERVQVLAEVLPLLNALVTGHNALLLGELLAQGLIMESERDATMRASFPLAFQSADQILGHIVDSGVMAQARFDAVCEEVRAQQDSPVRTARLRLLEEARATFMELATLDEEPVPRPRRSAWRTGLGAAVVCMLVAGGYQLVQMLHAVPGCASGTTTEAVHAMFSPMMSDAGVKAKLTDIREVGHVPAQRQRGCTATLVVEGESIPYAYIVGPLAEQENRLGVTGAQRAIVEARFRNVSADGDFGNQAAPIGRDQLEAALRAGVDDMPGMHRPITPNPVTAVHDIFNRVSERRVREIADIEPVGACRTVQVGTRYTCRVMVERNDPVLSLLNMPSEILDAEFTFERPDARTPWRVADDFPATFIQARHKARTATMAGEKSG